MVILWYYYGNIMVILWYYNGIIIEFGSEENGRRIGGTRERKREKIIYRV